MSEFENKIKLDNYSAQLKTVKSNIVDANKELERVLGDKNIAEQNLAELNADAESLRRDIGVLVKTISELEYDIRERRLQKEEIEKEYEDNLSNLKQTQKEHGLLGSIINRLQREREELVLELEELSSRKGTLNSDLDELVEKIRSVSNAISNAYGELDETHYENEVAREEKLREIRDMEQTIADLQELKRQEDAKIIVADEYIKNKENDIAVIKRRLKSLYNEIKPGVALSI